MTQLPFLKIVNGWPSIDIGAMRHQITILQLGAILSASPPSYDAAGPTRSFTPFITAMAAIDTVRGIDVIKSGQITTQLYLTLAMWWQPGVLPNMQVQSDNGSRYVIQSVENILEINTVLILNCIGLGPND